MGHPYYRAGDEWWCEVWSSVSSWMALQLCHACVGQTRFCATWWVPCRFRGNPVSPKHDDRFLSNQRHWSEWDDGPYIAISGSDIWVINLVSSIYVLNLKALPSWKLYRPPQQITVQQQSWKQIAVWAENLSVKMDVKMCEPNSWVVLFCSFFARSSLLQSRSTEIDMI